MQYPYGDRTTSYHTIFKLQCTTKVPYGLRILPTVSEAYIAFCCFLMRLYCRCYQGRPRSRDSQGWQTTAVRRFSWTRLCERAKWEEVLQEKVLSLCDICRHTYAKVSLTWSSQLRCPSWSKFTRLKKEYIAHIKALGQTGAGLAPDAVRDNTPLSNLIGE